ncbi:DUF3108 domain-containing protein [Hippea maritima]|uniref:DUF3108 domain-containing protein n=1 Tax=Hippea maritima (strain ATCC 700847 / DSM 10411 / MH2) TaxID=760142 RepID=F2LY36_HIPMA|nr:DUF3108 domain-containing protein [Hippea maritima]AEA34359.1 hypothetical protein Hipma_1403 [Hippea maritima DSM 10411]
MYKFFVAIFLLFSVNAFGFSSFEAKYKFDFSGLTAGYGTLSVEKDNSTYKLNFNGKTTAIVRFFYRLDVNIEDIFNYRQKRSVMYKSYQKTSRSFKKVSVKFDNATYADVLYEKNNNAKKYKITSKNGVYSPLYVYLFFLNRKFEFNKIYYKDVVVSKHLYRVTITPLQIETINLDLLGRKKGKRKALKVSLAFYKLTREGALKKKKEVKKLFAWISMDDPKVPLLIEMWHIIGKFRARLVSLEVY